MHAYEGMVYANQMIILVASIPIFVIVVLVRKRRENFVLFTATFYLLSSICGVIYWNAALVFNVNMA